MNLILCYQDFNKIRSKFNDTGKILEYLSSKLLNPERSVVFLLSELTNFMLSLPEDIFPCKDCGIWYRSERNLQAHLMYYCASRQKQPAAASSPPQDKPKESYPNERICPFPQCNKSCPSASSLEIHMRTHSGK